VKPAPTQATEPELELTIASLAGGGDGVGRAAGGRVVFVPGQATEQIELAVLAQWFYGRPRATGAAHVDVAAILRQLVAFFASRCGTSAVGTSGEVDAALKTLAGAMSLGP